MRRYIKHVERASPIILIVILLALFNQSLALEQDAGDVLGSQNACFVFVGSEGKGQVVVQKSGQEPRSLQSGPIEVNCDESVTLTARPQGPWKFDGWQGVEGAGSKRPKITVNAPAEIKAVFTPRELTFIPAKAPYYDRSGELVETIPIYEPLWQPLDLTSVESVQTNAPGISIWYSAPQPFGQPGVAQQYVNILGTVSDPDMDLVSLEYNLNGGDPVSMNFGGNGSVADGRRLWNTGDFVVDLDINNLEPGQNNIQISAKDSVSNLTTMDVIVDYTPDASGWPLPSNVVWNNSDGQPQNLLEVSQVVDGKWEVVADGVRTTETGYDRLLDIGDINWTSYEALLPITIHAYSEDGFSKPVQYAPAIGLVLHWQGHTDNPVDCRQPKCGWLPVGMANWYEWDQDESGKARFSMWAHHSNKELDPSGLMLNLGDTYLWKVQVNNAEGSNGIYRMKIWPLDQPEPAAWLMEKPGTIDSRNKGSLLLLAHHVDVTFGNVRLRELGGDFNDPVISALQIDALDTEATISWKTDELATCELTYWKEANDKLVVRGNPLVNLHAVTLENLEPLTTYDLRIRCEDDSLNESKEEGAFETNEELFVLEILSSPGGKITVQDGNPDNLYQAGESVTLRAEANPDKKFVNWLVFIEGIDTPLTYKQNPLALVVTNNTIVKALFGDIVEEIYLPLVQVSN